MRKHKEILLRELLGLLKKWYPKGKINAHDFRVGNLQGDEGSSLSICIKGENSGLWHDHATREKGDILDLFAIQINKDIKSQFQEILKTIEFMYPEQFSTNNKYKEEQELKNLVQASQKNKTTWLYTDKYNNPLLQIERIDIKNGKKVFFPTNIKNGKKEFPKIRILYNLPQILISDFVVFTEGEKCAEAIKQAGYCGTTLPGGSNTLLEKSDLHPLKNKKVCIWPDNDQAGKKWAKNIQNALNSMSIWNYVLELPEFKPEKWDAADCKKEEINTIIQTVLDTKFSKKIFSAKELFLDTSTMPENYIEPGILGPNGLLLIAGPPKVGKSMFLMEFLGCAASGTPFLGLPGKYFLQEIPPKAIYFSRPLKVLYLQAEMPYFLIRDRIEMLINIFNSGATSQSKEAGKNINQKTELLIKNLFVSTNLTEPLTIEKIKEYTMMIKHSYLNIQFDIIALDPFRNFFDENITKGTENMNSNAAVIKFLTENLEIFRKAINPKAGIILVHHTRKILPKEMLTDPMNAITGAGALRGAYTSGMVLLNETPADPKADRKLFFDLRYGKGIPHKILQFDCTPNIFGTMWIEKEEKNSE